MAVNAQDEVLFYQGIFGNNVPPLTMLPHTVLNTTAI